MTQPLQVMVVDHQGKSRAIAEGLARAGCRLVNDPTEADVVLIDLDLPAHGKLQYAEACVAAGGRAFIYPHGATAGLLAIWDGLFPISPIISGVLTSGPGHAEVGRRFGYPHPVHDIGWTLCPLRPRRTAGRVENVLFAANHPKGNGHLSDWKMDRNRDIFLRLLKTDSHITIRYIGTLEQNGLWVEPGVEYIAGQFEDSSAQLAQIDAADVVISDRSTFSNMAIARGVTTVMFDSDVIARDLDKNETTDHIDLYRDYIRFPFDAAYDGDLQELMQAAADDEELVGEWRSRFIGKPFDAHALVEILAGRPKAGFRASDYADVTPPSQRLAVDDLVPHGDTGVLVLPQAGTAADYLDGAERYLLEALKSAGDVSLFSQELRLRVHDWASLYHLTPYRATILDALGLDARDARVLELGAGCGAVTRWLGENFDSVHAVEGSFARAHVARERTRDLHGVRVAATNFFDLDFAGSYDLATLIGVLEYSHLYHPEFRDDPWRAALSNLELVRDGLDDEGMLVIAIENKFGLKYLSGAHEDHAAKQWEGIVGYPSRMSAVTWSAVELERMVQAAGFSGCDFYLPFPDYKLAKTMIDASLADPSTYPANWVETPFPDRVSARTPLYNESLALREVVSGGLLRDLANSFVVLAYKGDRESVRARLGVEDGWVARHYSLDRRPAFCKRTSLEQSAGGLVVRNIAAAPDAEPVPGQLVLTQKLEDEAYRPGHQLHFQLLELGAAGRLAAHLPPLLRRFHDFLLERYGAGLVDGSGVPLLRGEALDVVWWNVISDPETGDWHAIDGEWTFRGVLPLDFVLWRGLHHLVERHRAHLGDLGSDFTFRSVLDTVPRSSAARRAYFEELEAYIQYAAGASPSVQEPAAPPASVQLLVELANAPRSCRVIVFAQELVEHPELLDTYTTAFAAKEPVTLVAYAPDADVDALVPQLQALLACAQNDPDVMLVTVPREDAAEEQLAGSAQALLSLADADGPLNSLPRVQAGDSARLRELAFSA